jgi:mono/diheme cytochrome c family protein
MKAGKVSVTRAAALAAACVFVVGALSVARAEDAKEVYQKNCVSCHGVSGKADGPVGKMLKPPPKDFAAGLAGQSDADITKIIKQGGKAVGKAPTMPAYGSKLSDEQIQGVVAYIKGLK